MSRFKIVITELTTKCVVEKEWKQGADPDNGEHGFGYTSGTERMVESERKVLEQDVDTLDLIDVIRAINGIVL